MTEAVKIRINLQLSYISKTDGFHLDLRCIFNYEKMDIRRI